MQAVLSSVILIAYIKVTYIGKIKCNSSANMEIGKKMRSSSALHLFWDMMRMLIKEFQVRHLWSEAQSWQIKWIGTQEMVTLESLQLKNRTFVCGKNFFILKNMSKITIAYSTYLCEWV